MEHADQTKDKDLIEVEHGSVVSEFYSPSSLSSDDKKVS